MRDIDTEIPLPEADGMLPMDAMSPILTMIGAGQENLLTEDEFAAWSDYQDRHYPKTDSSDHNANLAVDLEGTDRSWLSKIATDVIDWVDTDMDSRRDWERKEARGIRLLGISTETVGGGTFTGASRVTHPLLAEAVVQFQARAIAEMWPPAGPVKTVVMGDATDAKEQQSQRVEGYMNFQYTTLMPGAFEEEDKLLFRLPISGSCFKKVTYDPLESLLVSRFVESSNMIVPYSASDLQSAIRYTERYEETGNDTLKKIAGGIYRDITLLDANSEVSEDSLVRDEIDSTEGRVHLDYEGDAPYIRYEMYCYLDIPGFEDKDRAGKETGVSLPYIVTVDKDQQEVLSIRRGWKEGDTKKRRKVYHVHYKFLPGLGFYGYGLLHTIGGLGEAATGALRALLDAAGFSNLQGGYRSRDAKLMGGDDPVGMGEWKEVDISPEEIKNAFVTLPYKEPSKALMELLDLLGDLGTRFASTTENMVGDAKAANAPVGTTLALIEQGSKIFSGIHLRLHKAHAREFKLLANLNKEYLAEQYPYDVPGESRMVMKADFDDRVDVIPVSDPNTISNTQRIARAQAVLELAETHPDLYDLREAHKSMLEALRAPNIAELMPEQEEIQPADPVSENSAIMVGEPVKAFLEDDHEAHMTVHQAWWSTRAQEDQERLAGAYLAHIAEHKAMDYRLHMESLMGPLDQIPSEQIAAMAAQASQLYIGEVGIPEENQDPATVQQGEEQRKNVETEASIKRKDYESFAQIARDDDKATAEIERLAGKEIQKSIIEGDKTMREIDRIPGQ